MRGSPEDVQGAHHVSDDTSGELIAAQEPFCQSMIRIRATPAGVQLHWDQTETRAACLFPSQCFPSLRIIADESRSSGLSPALSIAVVTEGGLSLGCGLVDPFVHAVHNSPKDGDGANAQQDAHKCTRLLLADGGVRDHP